MRKIRSLCVAGFAATLVLLAGCGGGDADSEIPLNFSVIASRGGSYIRSPRFTVTKSAADWEALWTEHAGSRLAADPLPFIDFSQVMAIGVFLGDRPSLCYLVAIKAVLRSAEKITVQYKENKPDPFALCPTSLSQPSQVATIPLSNLPVAFVEVN